MKKAPAEARLRFCGDDARSAQCLLEADDPRDRHFRRRHGYDLVGRGQVGHASSDGLEVFLASWFRQMHQLGNQFKPLRVGHPSGATVVVIHTHRSPSSPFVQSSALNCIPKQAPFIVLVLC